MKPVTWATATKLAAALTYAACFGYCPTNAVAAPAGDGATGDCSGLAHLSLDGVAIVSARAVAADTALAGVGVRHLPAFCRVAGRIHAEPGSNIGFEVWLPATGWDGRLHGIGIGGFAGSISVPTLAMTVKAGQVGVATDTGHEGSMQTSAWAKGHPERVRDYGWRAIHLSTVAARQLVHAFYGRNPDHAYFVGCSGGGRQGLMEAARFPEDYDGIVSGAPAASFTELVLAMVNAIQAQLPPGAAILPAQARLLQAEVIRQCDGIDGQVDGLIADPRKCRFDAARLACGPSAPPLCFSPAQIAALRRIHAGPHDAAGRPLAGGYLPSGSEPGDPAAFFGWDGYLLARPGDHAQDQALAGGVLQDIVQHPFATTASFDFDRDTPRLRAEMARDIDAPADLRAFFARGGKLVLWHGWADAAIPPEATLRYRAAMLHKSGPAAAQSLRLFMVPGVQHCLGGTGPDDFGQESTPQHGATRDGNLVQALQDWVEGSAPAPEAIVGRRGIAGIMALTGGPGPTDTRERLICAWPKKPVLRSGANPDQASSYTCT